MAKLGLCSNTSSRSCKDTPELDHYNKIASPQRRSHSPNQDHLALSSFAALPVAPTVFLGPYIDQLCARDNLGHGAAMDHLLQHGITVPNLTRLLSGVKEQASDMRELINKLSGIHIVPYHVCLQEACEGEDLCVLLSVALQLEKEIRGPILDYQMPKLVVDLPNGGGKRLTSTSESYTGGAAVHAAPGLSGMKGWKKLMTAIQKPDKSMPMLGRRHCATGCGMTGVTCLMGIESYPLFVRLCT
ncbi:hypothetical protein HBH98_232340 [Parastagonospora nodorum]|nr:hypothetical protein HBH49_206650 [Parastagonospora nodorum]KAH4084914.1 hypothetical protein HBH46_210290 [Parastagonospora nodorum]KAH4335564.1 hypothetical protein HBH98_232340 [Parastagonospora nodorum]KAH4355083.1 hypothetical protein HBH97_241080 [Parastagonospora nodorum]KAH4371966.1 hypothetical protein HBH99_233640 [Parastagonospora nodorum]